MKTLSVAIGLTGRRLHRLASWTVCPRFKPKNLNRRTRWRIVRDIVATKPWWSRGALLGDFSLDMTGAAAVVRIAYAVVGPLCQLGGPIVARLAIFLYRKLLARPIDVRWPRP